MRTYLRYPLLLATLLLVFYCRGQEKDELTITRTEVQTGIVSQTHDIIKGTRFGMDRHIHEWYIDSIRNDLFMILQTPKKNNNKYKSGALIALYDLNTNTVKWTQKLLSTNLYVTDKSVIETLEDGSYCLSKTDGKKLWKIKEHVIFTYGNIGIAWDKEKKLNGIDLSTGTTLWKRKVKGGADEIENVIPLNDSVMLVLSHGLETINLYDGDGWAHKFAVHDVYISPAGIFAGALLGLPGVAISSIAMPDQTQATRSHSDVLLTDNKIYFASKRTLLCYGLNGNTIWEKHLPSDSTTGSIIGIYKDNIILINKGFIAIGSDKKDEGTAFWAVYNRSTGNEQTGIISEEYTGFTDYAITNDTLYLLTTNSKIIGYSLTNGKQLFKKPIVVGAYLQDKIYNGNEIYVKSPDGSIRDIGQSYPGNHFTIQTDTGLCRFSPTFDLLEVIPNNKIWYEIAHYGRYHLQYNTDEPILTDGKQQIANITVSKHTALIKNKLYSVEDNSFTITDLSNILK